MKKPTNFIVYFTILIGFIFSCEKENIESKKSKNLINETSKFSSLTVFQRIKTDKINNFITDFKEISNSKSSFNGLQIIETRMLDGVFQDAPYSMLVARLNNGDFAYDVDKNGIYDFGIHPVLSDFSEVIIFDNLNNLLGSAFLIINSKPNSVKSDCSMIDKKLNSINYDNTKIAEVYIKKFSQTSTEFFDDILAAQKPTVRSCFESTCSSAEGIAGAVVANFFGPWAAATYYAGIWARCAYLY